MCAGSCRAWQTSGAGGPSITRPGWWPALFAFADRRGCRQAVLRAASINRLPVAGARRTVAAAISHAETLRSQFLAGAPAPPTAAWGLAAGTQLEALGRFCEAHGLGARAVQAAAAQRGPESQGAGPALARAAAHLWLWFDARCAQLAAEVGARPRPMCAARLIDCMKYFGGKEYFFLFGRPMSHQWLGWQGGCRVCEGGP